mmetsp:Transcript_6147/g.18571  ORF Transcript_6147/g.18571 Transcript_6147/m.18571 type:complete len:399 (-) Transcript_6147:349-1545(-)
MKLPECPRERVALTRSVGSVGVMRELLARNSASRSMKYGAELVFHNHLGAMVTASAMLGASEEALRETASGVDEPGESVVGEFRLGLRSLAADEAVSTTRIEARTWREGLGGFGLYGRGTHTTYPAYREFFAAERERLGAEGALREYFPALAKGLGGDFFHAVIELGYYFEADCAVPETLDSGLAWLAAAYVEWPEADAARFESPLEAAKALDSIEAPFFDLDDGSSGYIAAMETLRDAHLDAVYACDLRVLDPPTCLKEVCLVAADSFASTGAYDFYTLHSVTGSRAVWAILSALDWPEHVQRDAVLALWRTMLFTHLVRRRRDRPDPALPDPADWTDLADAALQSRNSHLIKIVYTCADFYDRWRDPRHATLAATAIARHRAGVRLRGTGAGSKVH